MNKKLWITLILIVTMAASLIGCGKKTEKDETTSQPSGTVTEAAAGDSSDKTLTVGVISVADQPFNPGTIALSSLEQIEPVFDTLIFVDKDGNYIPGLATEWTLSEDKLSFTLKLREGVKFQDGSELTSADVKFTLEYYASDDSKQADKNLLIEYVKSIDTPDNLTVVINFNSPCTEFEYLLSEGGTGTGIVLPKAYFEKVGADGFSANPIGTGPFKLEKFSAGEEIDFVANEDYWQGAADVNKLIFRQISEESTRISELQAGNIDFAPIGATSASLFENDEAVTINTVDYSSSLGIFISGAYDSTGAATQNSLVREAMNYAINRQELADGLFEGKATASGAWGVFPFTTGYDTVREITQYDPDKAKELLEEAGYPDQFSNPVIKFYDTAAKVYSSEVVQAVAAYWQAVGLEVEIVSTDRATLGALYSAKPLDSEFSGSVYLFDPPKKYSAHDAFQAFYPSNSTFGLIQGNTELDGDITQLAALDGSDRSDTVNKILDLVAEANVSIPLVYPSQDYAVGSKVESWDSAYAAHWGNWFYSFKLK